MAKRGRPVGDRKGNRVAHRDDGVTEIYIPSKRHGDKVALVDSEDWLYLSACTWTLRKSARTFYAVTTAWDDQGVKTTLPMHRAVSGHGFVDHRNSDGLDNRRSNLRPAGPAQNAKNLRRAVNNTSGYTGVFFDRTRGNWRACVESDGKRHYAPGRFDTAAEAAAARDVLALKLHGEFARPTLGGA